MFTTNLTLLMPVIGVAAGLVAAMLVVRVHDLRLAPVGFGVRGAKLLVPHYVTESGMIALGIPLAIVLLGSTAMMLKQYLTPPPVKTAQVFIPWDPDKWKQIGIDNVDIEDPAVAPTATKAPNFRAIPKPVEDDRAETDAIDTQDDLIRQANAVVRNDEPSRSGPIELQKLPELVKRIDPVYPSFAIKLGCQGRVWVQALLDIDGRVLRAEISRSSGYPALDEAAQEAVRQWVFTPAIAPDGRPTKVWQMCPINFKLSQ
jgi:TonB family protein